MLNKCFQIDSMFFDHREDPNPNGRILVITCEGNAGFYEIGFLGTPLDAGYSVLGWNHPGFGGSSGSPFPMQETNAMDAVVQVGSSTFWILCTFFSVSVLTRPIKIEIENFFSAKTYILKLSRCPS
jgi:hypothetical protein